nr:MAG TPA: hypothetical protein [Caudoviricetes sp.]
MRNHSLPDIWREQRRNVQQEKKNLRLRPHKTK